MKNRKEGLSALWYAVLGVLLASCFSGCMAALSAVTTGSAALDAFSVTKIVQSQMDPNVGANFKAPDIEDKIALAAMTKVAVWPDMVDVGTGMRSLPVYSPAALAEQLSRSGFSVVTPFSVSKVLEANGLSHAVNMTEDEQRSAFKLVAEKTGADAVIYSTPTGMKADMRAFTFSRSSMSSGAVVQIYSISKDAFIWRNMGEIVYKHGAGIPNTAEGERLFVAELAKSLSNSRGVKASPSATAVAQQ